jgi:hypothetical protein
MTVKTVTIYGPGHPTEEAKTVGRAYITQLVAQGATDGIIHAESPGDGTLHITRFWTTINDATTWAAYIADWNPISVEVIE